MKIDFTKIDFTFEKNINKIENVWYDLQKSCNVVPNMSFDFVKAWNSTLKQKINFLKHKAVYLVVKYSNTAIAILPLIQKTNNIYESQYLLDYYDIIYNINYSEFIEEIIINIINKSKCTFEFKHINETSKLYSIFKNKDIKIEESEICAKIIYENGYDNYLNTLSKNAKQNLRTSYNRLNTDKLNFELFEIHNEELKLVYKDLNNIYIKRRINKYKNLSGLHRLIYKIKEPILSSLIKSNNAVCFYLKIGNEIAAYLVGMKHEKSLLVPRLVIDEKFTKYSVGNMLINETIKHSIKNNLFNILDLTTGTEKYKYVMGGIEHKNYTITIKKKGIV